ncbi:hypothetical protein [Sphingomonas pokkalii]|uniref:Aerotolerance regulator N-terminal domain-containing protein n=1 Tax=Sphingomonas pokkalii TaxID=2175090 RepID=A0A2U0SD90_9SPHN|nr:hypothetical protein [Sphingomonas pokkalii]PVX29343.1 hypothetical protein DD559_08435 [Sphingomonas pokkalii]
MSFATFGLAGTIAGALALVALLYLLQRLRARRRVVHLPAAALWAQAMREAPARALGGRFRHWLAFALIVAIALALWLAAAHPQAAPAETGASRRFYLDNSALLAPAGELARAKRALLADVRATPAQRRAVFLGDAAGTRLLAPGESDSLLARRLDLVTAEARPSGFGAWLRRTGESGPGDTIRYYGGWPVLRDATPAAPRGTAVQPGYLARAVPDNRGIVALGATPARSGMAGRADILVAVAAARGESPSPSALRWTLDGKPFAPTSVENAGGGQYLVRNVAATGQVLQVTLAGNDGFPQDDAAALRLPDRTPLRVALLGGTPDVVRAAIAADGGLTIVPAASAQVAIGDAGATGSLALPALVFTDPARQGRAFAFAEPDNAAKGALADRLDELGLAQVDASAIADALGKPIGVDITQGARRRVGVWRALFAPDSPFALDAAMPIFLAQSLRWLGNADGWRPYAKAGAPIPDQSRLYGLPDRAGADLLGVATRIDAAPVALTDRAVTLAAADTSARPAVAPEGGALPADLPFVLLVLAAGLLLAAEWWLLQRGLIA